jgi:signal transduction histidine kinase
MRADRLHLRDVRHTSTFRLTLLLGLVAAAGMTALIGLIYILSARELTTRTDRILLAEAALLTRVSSDSLPERVEREVSQNTSGLTYIALQAADGERLVGNLRVANDFPVSRPVNIPARPGRHPALRVLAVRAVTGETILIGRDITPILDLRRRVATVLIASGLGIAVLVLAAGVVLSRAPLRRVRDLRQACAEIAGGRFDQRMPVSRRGDELDLFAATVNAMVDEVARVVAQVKHVTDAIAHDLRTPLTRVRGQLHRTRTLGGADHELAALATAAIADLDEVLERFSALLRISELEAAGRRSGFAEVRLAPVLTTVHDLYEPLAEEAGVGLRIAADDEVSVRCDERLLVEALSNLVDNALKFTPAGGLVALAVEALPGGALLTVRDDGPGIAPADRDAVLRRFGRAAAGAGIPGNGLGLSVVAAIAHLHGFALELDDASPGLIARLRCMPSLPR